jgi:transketolase N-terminal domain/subunit
LLPLAVALRDYESVTIDEPTAAMVRQGRVLPRFAGEGPWAVLDVDGELLAMYEAFRTEEAKPAVVIAGP